MGSSLLGAGASVSLSGEREPLTGRARAQAQPGDGRAQPLAGRGRAAAPQRRDPSG